MQYSYKEVETYYADYFDLVVESQEYSNDIPSGAIIKQTPAEGKDYIIGNSTVKVIVSKGPRMVTIPNVYELDSNTALNMLKDNEIYDILLRNPVNPEKVLVNEANRLENKKVRKAYRDAVKAFEVAVANGEKNLEDLHKKAVSEVDKAWSKGVLKRNTADRKKAHLAKLLVK